MTSDTPRMDAWQGAVDVETKSMNMIQRISHIALHGLVQARQLERELAAATADRDALRLRVAQLEGVGDMWRAAELALADVKRDRDGYALQAQRLTDELRQATRGSV